uniref:hypothetical protein n=1 Tax=Psychromonas sp. Urea-02u-13 TaxID=2058326 RepID=UPI000CACA7B6
TISFSNFANLVAGSGGDIFNIDAAIGNLTGGAGNDTFTLLTNGFATTIDGGTSGTDELIGWNSAINTNTWVVDAVNTLSNGTNSVTFSNIDDLQGGTGIDNFTVNASIENINAGSGDDVINVSDTHLITGRIDGQDGANDTINLTAAGQTLDLATFSAVEFVNGFVSGTSTLQGSNTQINTWDITTLGNTVGGITFTNFADLIAGSQGDTFNINDSIGNLTGGMGGDHFNITASTASIDAGAGNDIINIATTALVTGSIEGGTGINDVLNITTEAQTLDLSTLVGIEAVNALSTGGPNTLQAGNSATNTWNVTSTNTGNVAGITFSNFADLEAGSGGDIFNIDAIIGNLKGGDGIDVFNIVATTASVNAGGGNDIINIATRALVTGNIDGSTGSNDRLNLTTAAQTLDLSTLLGIEAVNALSTGASNTLQAGNTTTNTWNITSANTGNVEGISFSNFADLEAGSGGDIFNIDAIIGHLKGGNGSDTFNITATTASVNAGAGDDIINIDATALVTGSIDGSTGSNDVLNLTSEAQTLVLSDLVGIEAVNALATGGNNTLQGQDTNNTWLITDTNKGTLNNTITFSNFANLIGGNKDDNFSIGSFSEIGKIDGGNATTIDSVTITDASQTIVIGTDAVNIESYTATSGVNTLQGADTNNTWNINGSNQGTLNGDIGFANFANLVGGNQDDSFSLGSFVNIGKIDGGDASTIDSVTVTDASQTIVIGADAVNIESYIATSGINTLQGENVANTWLITDANKGTLNNTIGFSNFANLVGGNQNDAFSLGSFSEIGKIDGGDASTMDTVTVTDASQIVLIGTDAVNIESYVATSGTNTLQGSDDSQNTWNVTSANSGHVGSVSFTNFADLVAGSKGDTFNINYLIGNLTGGAGDDNFNINANANSLNAGLGNDTVTLDNINRVNIPMDGGVGDTDSLILTGASQDLSLTNISNFEIVEAQHSSVHTLTAGNDINTWTIDGSNSGDVAGVDFKGFSRLKGGTLADHFTVTETGKIDKMYGNEGDDSFILNTVSSLSTNNSYVDGGIGNDSLTVNTSSNTWLIKNGYDGEVENGLVVREFYSVENLSSAPGSSDTQDYSQYVGIVAIDLNKTTGIGEVIGNGRDSTVIGRDVTNTWLISGTDAGSVSYYDGFNDVTFVFSDVLNLTGGSGIDTFAIGDSGSLDGNIKGGGGVNTLLGSNIESTWNVTTENAGSLLYAGVTTNFEDVSELIGGDQIDTFNINALVNSLNAGSGNDQIYLKNIDIVNSVIDGGEGADTIHLLASNQVVNVATSMTGIEIVNGSVDAENTLQANNGNNIWAIDGANAGDLNGLRFTNFSHLEGGSSVDTFTFENNTATLNSILAGSGNDIVNMASIDPNIQIDAGEGTSDTLNITGSNQTVKLSDITNFEMVNAADGVNTLQAKDSIANTWLISANNTGTVDGVRFSNFGQLKGGDGIDNFTLSDIDFVSGLIDGGGGANTVNLTTANQTVVIEKDITNIGTLNASSGSNMLQASDISNEWNITDNDKGTVNGLSFSNFSDLLGGTGQDEFSLTSISQISGKIDGGLGNDSVMLSAANQHIILDADITRIELLHAAAGINTLQGADIDNTWNITGDNTGNVAGVTFDNISDIVGGNEVDNFNVSDISQISGLIDGAGGRDNLTLTGTAQTVELGVNVTQVENLVATEEDAHLVGSNNANVWTIDGENSGFLTNNTGTVNFSGFKNMTGGRSIDQFTLSGAGDVTGLIDGGSGSDSLEITANDIQIIELGNNTNDNLNVVNMESIVANSATENTLLAGNVSNTWLVNGNESGSVAYSGITTLFSNFDHLTGGSEVDKFNVAGGGVSSISMGQGADTITLSGGNVALISGGEGDDTFTVSGGTANLMQGDSGTDYVTYMLDNVSVTIGDDIVGFEGVTAQKGNGTITAQDDVLTTWVINELNKGTVTDTSALSTLLAFSGFSTVTGGSGIDNFTVSGNGVITNMINGGGSADTLNVILDKQSRTESAVINFNGGEGADVVNITGTANSFSETYTPNVSVDGNQFDQLHFTKENSSTNVAINFRDVTSVNDDIATTSLVINSGQNADTLYLDATQFSTDSASVNISFESLLKGDITIAGIGSSLVLTDSVDVNGDLSISANEVRQTSGSVNTDRLLLNNVIAMGVGDAIETNVSELLIADHSGDIYLNQSGDINFSQLSNSSGDVNINVTNGDVNASNGLTSSGNLTLAATKINLSGNNQLTGNIDLSANDIVLNNDALTRIVGLSSQNVSVTSTDSIIVEGDLLLASNGSGIATLLSSQGDVLLNGTTTADSLSITANNDVLINDLTAKNLTINAITGDIVGNGTVAISSNVDEVTTTLVANAGNITFTDENNDFDAISVTANSATITDVNGISVLDSELASNLIVNSNGEMKLGRITAGESLYFNAGNANIVSENSSLTAPVITLRATTGIGEGLYDTLLNGSSLNTTGAINTETALLSAINTDSGLLFINNGQNVAITDLRNKGDIIISNAGDITLQTTTASSGNIQGAIDANYGLPISNQVYSGSVAIINDGAGSVYTTGVGFNEPDIIAENLLVNSVTSFGTAVQPIRLRVNNDFTLIGSLASIHYYGAQPNTITTSSDLVLQVVSTVTGLSGQQLVEVEPLSEVDPAIFADVRNYTVDDISIYLPKDQRVDENEEEEYEEEYDQDI